MNDKRKGEKHVTITDECTDRLTHETIKMLTKYVGVIICWALLFRLIKKN